ncbi:outer membrane efflux protein [Pseudopedobacter saltans DSM 12145]|uniref:Outer membrane efflux protein n=1 Tax=Pseudopedobacter saltans (strain ATCC 51119 / DSM 12145 / JCM 21818 / CCUG 39354 / LMG 10337 / NBRC 100064 / NCIMB 13643) TaxID=762903 RepID=F0SET7_PSESL|nr:TolC family protein [Pseudopedobacter saltans]ADY53003.1 outer membrane efflux protein [Pseudopedobacter saltans DSM 12145]
MKSIRFLITLISICTFTGAFAQSTQLTLKDALKYALDNNTAAKKAVLEIDKGKFKTQEVRAQALPQITGNAGLTYNAIIGMLVADIGGQTQSIKMGQAWNSVAGVQLSQQLFNQQVFTGLQAAKSSEAYYRLNAQLTEEQVIEQVANNYYQVLVNRQQLNVIDTNIKNVKIVEKIIANQYQNGLAKKIDVDRINVNLTNLNTQRAEMANAITMLENQLKFSMGMPIHTPISLPSSELTAVNQNPILADTINLSARTEMQLMDVQKNLLNLQRKAYVSEYYPNLSLNANYNYNSQANSFDFLKSNRNAIGFDASAIGLTLRIPIFNGFSTRSRVRQAEIEIKEFEADRLETTNALNMAYENAKIQLRNSINTINSQKKNAELANEIYLSTQNNYNNGLASLTDLLDTENALTQAQNSYTQALLNYKIAEIQLIKSKGDIKTLAQ